MQFTLKRLFAAVFASALLTIILQAAIERRPQLSAPAVLVLAAPALLGLGIFAFSITMAWRQTMDETSEGTAAVSKYKNLAAIGVFAVMPLAVYIGYCCIVATPQK
jgi:ABC-type Mn2+/Zn2+ transport system permease subunit